MKLLTENEIEVTSTFLNDGERHKYHLDESSIHIIMSMLTDAYSDPILAVIREMLTNARDSHIEAGLYDVPVEVILPTEMDQRIIIKDRGTGLNTEQACKVFTGYGYSTKRHSDDYNGMLGIGSKSPLAYCDAFMVDAYKDGTHTSLVISRNEEGLGELDIEVMPTDHENGVVVEIPVKRSDIPAFKDKARWLLQFWRFPALIDGEPAPEFHFKDFEMVSDELALSPASDYSLKQSYVVMGDVPYEVPDGFNKIFLSWNSHLCQALPNMSFNGGSHFAYVLWVPIGSVRFANSREKLMDEQRTTDFLTEFRKWFSEYGDRILYDLAADLPMSKVMKSYKDGLLNHWKPFWEGTSVPSSPVIQDEYRFNFRVEIGKSPSDDIEKRLGKIYRSHQDYDCMSLFDDERRSILVKGFKPINVQSDYLRRIILAAAKDGLDLKDVGTVGVYIDGPTTNRFYEFDHIIGWERVKDLTRQKRLKRSDADRLAGCYIQRHKKPRAYGVEELDDAEPIVFYHPSDNFSFRESDLLWKHDESIQIVKVYKKKITAFERLFPDAKHYIEAMGLAVEKLTSGLDYKDLFALMYSTHRLPWRVSRWDLMGMKDVRVRRCLESYHTLRRKHRKAGLRADGDVMIKALKENNSQQYEIYKEVKNRIQSDYPLLGSTSSGEECVEYVNAMYDYRRA